jgi:RNA polymerase sigma-70 factor (ECF subfamily)
VTGTAALDEFQDQRHRLFGIAYRMLGSATDAEDVLQDAWLRWQGVDRARVADPAAFLARTVTNLCLTALTSARARRESYVGPWLPEPVLTGEADAQDLGPLDDTVQRESVSFALLTLLERLSPAERAAYVLREAFAYSPREVGELIGTTEANVRQLHSRARRHLAVAEFREVDAAHWQELTTRFLSAARDGDVAELEALLTADVVSRADGGGIVSAARRPVQGRENVARYVAGLVRRFGKGARPAFIEVNGAPAVALTDGGSLRGILLLHTDGERLTGLDWVVSPGKLAFAERQLSRIGGLAGLSASAGGAVPA